MEPRTSKRLSLRHETLCELTSGELAVVVGALNTDTCDCYTRDCSESCSSCDLICQTVDRVKDLTRTIQ